MQVVVGCLLLVGLVLVCAVADAAEEKKETDITFTNLTKFVQAVSKADKVVLYEGLPHQIFEAKELEKEKADKKVVTLHGFPFYAETLDLKADDAKALSTLYTADGSFKQWQGYKRCGGFHPDYALEWHVGTDKYQALICFGCTEVKSFGPKVELYCDMTEKTKTAFEKLLKPYHKNRPKRPE
jgi:hypothetical protein